MDGLACRMPSRRAAVATSLITTSLVTTALISTALGSPAQAAPRSSGVELDLVGTNETGVFDASADEITAHDPDTQRLFVVNAQSGTVDVLDVSDPTDPTTLFDLPLTGLPAADGSRTDEGVVANSVDVRDGILAVAVQAADKTDLGWVAFFSTAGSAPFRSAVRVGSLPDMLTFTSDGRSVLVANEGEPADDFSSDPEGSVSLIALPRRGREPSQDDVRTATFAAFDQGRPLADGVRVFGPDVPVPAGQPAAGRVARNLEPEFIAVDSTRRTAWVTLQEANAVAVLDLRSGEFTDVWPIPMKDWSKPGNVLDASDRDDGIDIRNRPVFGLAMPDALASYEVRGRTYLVSANEGDAREWGDYEEPVRIGDEGYQLCPDVFPDADELKLNENLGRQNATIAGGLREAEGCYEQIQVFGGRSFSIFAADGELLFDSAGQIEQKIAELIDTGELPGVAFNANHTENPSFEGRSDDKGPEPEGVTVGEVDGRTYAFLGLERVGGVMVFDVTDPRNATYVDYVNNRNWDAVYEDELPSDGTPTGDLGAEGVEFITAKDSPTGEPLLAVANEVSGTTSLFSVTPVVADDAQRPDKPRKGHRR